MTKTFDTFVTMIKMYKKLYLELLFCQLDISSMAALLGDRPVVAVVTSVLVPISQLHAPGHQIQIKVGPN